MEEWCEYHASDPALAKYVAAGREGWVEHARDLHAYHLAKQAEEEAAAEHRRQMERSFALVPRPKAMLHHPQWETS